MPTGIAWPFQAVNGKVKTVTGEEQLKKLIMIRLMDCDSANPFVDLGIGSDMVFAIDSEETRNILRLRIAEIFAHFERQGRAKLAPGFPIFTSDRNQQELHADVRYINLETALPEELTIKYGNFGIRPLPR